MKREILQEDKKNKPKHFPYGYDMTYTHTHTHTYFRPKYSESDICCFMCTHVKTCYSECVLINGEDED